MRVFIKKFIFIFFIILWAARAHAYPQLNFLPHIIELKIVDNEHIEVISDGVMLGHVTADDGMIDDFYYIEAETGAIKKNEKARDPKELILNVNEGFEIGAVNLRPQEHDRFLFLKIENGQIIFHYNITFINARNEEKTISISPYKKEAIPFHSKQDKR